MWNGVKVNFRKYEFTPANVIRTNPIFGAYHLQLRYSAITYLCLMLSIWEKLHWTSAEFIVIGGGIVGLSTALSWREKHPDDTIIVVERGSLPTGASTRNAGFACFGSLTELLIDIENLGEEGCVELVERRWKGLQKLRSRLGDKAMDLQVNGGYELLRKKELVALNDIHRVNNLLKTFFQQEIYHDATDKIEDFGFNPDKIHAMLYNPLEGQLDSGKMMKSLVRLCCENNIEIRTGCNVKKLDTENCEVVIEDTVRKNYILKAQKIAVCTNAFSKELLPDLQINPGRGIVMVTEPIKDLPFKGTFHYDEGYYYFRDFGDRVIFGGGRNIAIDEETTTSFEINEIIIAHLKEELHHTLLPNHKPKIDMHWAGIMAFGENKQPIIRKISENVGVAVRLGGMGVAIGSIAGDELAGLLSYNL